MTAVYWSIGRRIVLEEQRGARRAEYGEELIEQLARRLTVRFARGFGTTNLKQMRSFYLAYAEIGQTLSDESRSADVADAEPRAAARSTEHRFVRRRLTNLMFWRFPPGCRCPGRITSSS